MTALVLVQPIQAAAEEIRIEIEPQRGSSADVNIASGVFDFNCRVFTLFPGRTDMGVYVESVVPDGISQNTIRNGNIIKTIHAEKVHHHNCVLEQGDIPVVVDVTIIGEIYEDVRIKSIISKQALVVTCVKDAATAVALWCKSETPPTATVPVGNRCFEVVGNFDSPFFPNPGPGNLGHRQEMDTVNKGSIVKTVESQKEVFLCFLPDSQKLVDLVVFTEIWEDLDQPDAVIKEFLAFRCVTALRLDAGTEDETRPAKVESCQFITIQD